MVSTSLYLGPSKHRSRFLLLQKLHHRSSGYLDAYVFSSYCEHLATYKNKQICSCKRTGDPTFFLLLQSVVKGYMHWAWSSSWLWLLLPAVCSLFRWPIMCEATKHNAWKPCIKRRRHDTHFAEERECSFTISHTDIHQGPLCLDADSYEMFVQYGSSVCVWLLISDNRSGYTCPARTWPLLLKLENDMACFTINN